MSAPKHTPGPWRVTRTPGDGKLLADVIGRRLECWRVVTDGPAPMADETSEADARLIAAAPEMLAMLERCEENLRGTCVGGGDYSDLCAVIAKARGES